MPDFSSWIKFDIRGFVFGLIFLIAHLVCVILWISGWAAGDFLKDNEQDGVERANPARYYFAWGMILWFFSMVATVIAFLLPVVVVRKYGLMFSLFVSLLLFFLLTITTGFSTTFFQFPECNEGGIDHQTCASGKVIFVASYLWMFTVTAQIVVSIFFMIDTDRVQRIENASFERM